jgi:orotate phosphoribosyltransferase
MTIIDLLKDINAIVTDDHFVYTSGKHGSVYVRKDLLYPHTDLTSQVCKMLADRVMDQKIDAVVGPSLGGIILAQWTASHLSNLSGNEVLALFTEKDDLGNQVFKRGYDQLVKDKNVFVVEDMTTTGGSVVKVVDSVKKAGGTVVSVGVMINRSPKELPVDEASVGAPFFALDELPTEIYDQFDCPLCKSEVPVNTTVGHGKKFMEHKEEKTEEPAKNA